MLENGTRPQAVVMVPGVFELNINRTPIAVTGESSCKKSRLNTGMTKVHL
jgi:hypothetical protein